MKHFFFACFFLSFIAIYGQNKQTAASVEKSIWGVQTGFFGGWAYNEFKLSNSISLRTEVGLDADLLVQNSYYENSKVSVAFTPVIAAEPRWYYNLNNRVDKSYDIDKNNGNFLSLEISSHPGFFVISNVDNLDVIPDLSLIPKWGIRRTIGSHFSYEVGLGFGVTKTFYDEDEFSSINSSDKFSWRPDFHLRIGYTF